MGIESHGAVETRNARQFFGYDVTEVAQLHPTVVDASEHALVSRRADRHEVLTGLAVVVTGEAYRLTDAIPVVSGDAAHSQLVGWKMGNVVAD